MPVTYWNIDEGLCRNVDMIQMQLYHQKTALAQVTTAHDCCVLGVLCETCRQPDCWWDSIPEAIFLHLHSGKGLWILSYSGTCCFFVNYLLPQSHKLLHSFILVKRKSMHNKYLKNKRQNLLSRACSMAGVKTLATLLYQLESDTKNLSKGRWRELNLQNCPLTPVFVPQPPPETYTCAMHR